MLSKSQKIGYLLSVPTLALTAAVLPTLAATDTDLSNALASSTSMVTDNKTAIITFIVGIGVVAFVITMSKIAVIVASKWAKKAFSGGKKR